MISSIFVDSLSNRPYNTSMTSSIISSIQNGIGHITLNSEKTLNALNQDMVDQMFTLLEQWKENEHISCVMISGSGHKAFCAGGDIKSLYLNPESCTYFFISEYRLDYTIHTYPKPIITWNSGITMGGGMGLMNGASCRIVTPNSILAMPEITIGLYPDVGATYFFNKLPSGVAFFLALTGARINAQDALELGLADFCLPQDTKEEELIRILGFQEWSSDAKENKLKITKVLSSLSIESKVSSLTAPYRDHLKKLDNIQNALEFRELIESFPPSEWIDKCRETFSKGSPSSAGIIIEQLKRGRPLGLKEAFESELNLSVHCSLKPDFREGVRALLIDKDQAPKWSPANLEDVTQEWIESYFTPLEHIKLWEVSH